MQTLTNEQLREKTPSVFSTGSLNRSDRYRNVSTIELVDKLKTAGYFPVKANQRNTRIEGNKPFVRHIVKFEHYNDIYKKESGQIAVNDQIPQIVLLNSHDGSSAYKLMLGIFRIVCSNGLIVSNGMVESISLRHTGNVLNEALRSVTSLTESYKNVLPTIEQWKARQLDYSTRLEYAKGATKQIFDDKIDIQPNRLIYSARIADKEPNLWNTFNVVQERIIKGLAYGINKETGRYTKLREVKSIDRDISINRQLWDYTANFMSN